MSDKIRSILIGAALAGIGAVGAYLTDLASGRAFGAMSPFVGMLISILVNAIRKYLEPLPPPTVRMFAGMLVVVLLLGALCGPAFAGPRCCGERPRLFQRFRTALPVTYIRPATAPAAVPIALSAAPSAPARVPATGPATPFPPALMLGEDCPSGRCPKVQ
jgi:hypothetical protein